MKGRQRLLDPLAGPREAPGAHVDRLPLPSRDLERLPRLDDLGQERLDLAAGPREQDVPPSA